MKQKKKAYLVINNNVQDRPDSLLYYDQYRIFGDLPKALEHAKSIGWETSWLGFNDAIGQMNIHWAGDIKVSILVTEVS